MNHVTNLIKIRPRVLVREHITNGRRRTIDARQTDRHLREPQTINRILFILPICGKNNIIFDRFRAFKCNCANLKGIESITHSDLIPTTLIVVTTKRLTENKYDYETIDVLGFLVRISHF